MKQSGKHAMVRSGAATATLRGILVAVAITCTAAAESSSQTPDGGLDAHDAVRPARPRLFERRVLFSPTYLGRLVAVAHRKEQGLSAVDRVRAGQFARRYRISDDLAATIFESALAEGIDPELAFRLVRVESVFQPNARGPRGALGLTQLMPSTARAIDGSLRTPSQIMEPRANLRTGFRFLRQLIERYNGNVQLGLLAYNRGPGTVDRALRAGRDPENGYTPKVLGSDSDRYTGTGLVTESEADPDIEIPEP